MKVRAWLHRLQALLGFISDQLTQLGAKLTLTPRPSSDMQAIDLIGLSSAG